MRASTLEGVLATPLVYLNQPGNYVLAALLVGALDVSSAAYGALVSVPFWCNFAQLFLLPLFSGRVAPRRVFMVFLWVTVLLWIPLSAVIVWLARHPTPAAPWIFGSFYAATCLGVSITGVAWTAYVQSWVPRRLRGAYFAHRNRAGQLALLAFLGVAAAALGLWGDGSGVFAALIGGALVLRVASIHYAHTTPAPGETPVRPAPLAGQLGVLRGDTGFHRFLIAGAAWGFAANLVAPFLPVYLMRQAGVSPGFAGGYFIVGVFFGALAFPAWGRLIGRHGSRPVMMCAAALWGAVNSAWFFVGEGGLGLALVLAALAGALNAGMVLGQFNLVLRLVPAHAKELAIGLNTAVTALATALAPLAGGALLDAMLARISDPALAYRGFFLLPALLALLAFAALRRVREPDTAPWRHVAGAMANVRTLGSVLGLGFLTGYLFDPSLFRRRARTPGDNP